ncbi:MAG: hypothetical protein JXQ99_19005 [Hyphomicrobiaceae bacterium]
MHSDDLSDDDPGDADLAVQRRYDLIEQAVTAEFTFETVDQTTYKSTLRYRVLKAIAEAAYDYALTQNSTVYQFQADLKYIGFQLERWLRDALTGHLTYSDSKRYDYWCHRTMLALDVRKGREREIWREDVEHVANEYMKLPYRIPDFERLLVDVLIATELVAYLIQAIGSKAKPVFGMTNPSSLRKWHPLSKLFVSFVFLAILLTLVGGILAAITSIAVGGKAAGIIGFVFFYVFWILLAISVIELPFDWYRHVTFTRKNRNLIQQMLLAYDEVEGHSIVSTRRVREALSHAANAGAVWPAPLFAILDDNIQRTGTLPPPMFKTVDSLWDNERI